MRYTKKTKNSLDIILAREVKSPTSVNVNDGGSTFVGLLSSNGGLWWAQFQLKLGVLT